MRIKAAAMPPCVSARSFSFLHQVAGSTLRTVLEPVFVAVNGGAGGPSAISEIKE